MEKALFFKPSDEDPMQLLFFKVKYSNVGKEHNV